MPSSADPETVSAAVTGLVLLDDVAWRGEPLPGRRTHGLLAALALAGGRPVGEQALVAAVWSDDDVPTNPAKALQVVVSRARAATDATVVVRTDHGYRLGLVADEVDALRLRAELDAAALAESGGELVAARDHARAALVTSVSAGAAGEGPLGELRAEAARQRDAAAAVLGRALSGLGEHAEALPLLRRSGAGVGDQPTAVALLRSLASVQGAASALERYESLRAELADRLGVDPGPDLQSLHAELLAADRPVRSGVRYAAASLVGREEDLRALRGLVRQSRVVSILGPGGLGKTRLANLLAAEAEQSVVHVVELVGVASPEDVVGEVGSALGVRDSVTGRRTLTPEQRRDVRARIAQALEQAPTLLVLDNCEHLVEAVADLVAYLVATVRDLRVVTTTRAPLAIAAERVFALGQLAEDAAVDLFAQRARSARPGVTLAEGPDGAVRRVVRRLDGLPLAIELAAAKVRVMSVEDIDRRLDDRFALLRGGDRSAPDRHQTLIAVIDWSWNLLSEQERRSLRWLSVFHDGFTLAAAETLLRHPDGADVLDDLQALADQSLLILVESETGVRYRMLETVREFGRMQLVGAGESTAAQAAQQAWARDLSAEQADLLWGAGQVGAVRVLVAEENNLTDCLRIALTQSDPAQSDPAQSDPAQSDPAQSDPAQSDPVQSDPVRSDPVQSDVAQPGPDPATAVCLVAALGWMWTIRGENTRVIAIAAAVEEVLTGWEPPEPLVDAAVQTVAAILINGSMGDLSALDGCRDLLHRHQERAQLPRVRGLADIVAAQGLIETDQALERLDVIAQAAAADDAGTAVLAWVWAAHERENAGDPIGAIADAERALPLLAASKNPWLHTLTHSALAGLFSQVGRHDRAETHARAALPGLDLLGADDDVAQTRSVLVFAAIAAGRLDDARAEIAVIEGLNTNKAFFGGALMLRLCRAELALACGRPSDGLDVFRDAAVSLRDLALPGLSLGDSPPWLLAGEAVAVAAYARYGSGDPQDGRDLHDALARRLPLLLGPGRPHLDYPMTGLALFALATWDLVRVRRDGFAAPSGWSPEEAIRLFVVAEMLAFPRQLPSIDPAVTEAAAEQVAPGLAERVRVEYAGLRPPELVAAARVALARG